MMIHVKTRDNGNGSEVFSVGGTFIGERDSVGKATFLADDGRMLYLFDDEWRITKKSTRKVKPPMPSPLFYDVHVYHIATLYNALQRIAARDNTTVTALIAEVCTPKAADTLFAEVFGEFVI